MFLGTWQIDDLLTFTVTTHNASTGALTDADAVPAYRVYEDETGTAILTGSMAKLDDANTTGHYSEQLTLSAANGFEAGKAYSIYVTAAVSSVTGGTTRSFQVEAAPSTLTAADVWTYATRTLTQSAASVTAAVSGSDITVYRGTTWSISLTNIGALTSYDKVYMTVKASPIQADSDAVLQVFNDTDDGLIYFNGAAPASVANGLITIDDIPTGDITVTVQPAETISAPLGTYHYDVKGVDFDGLVVELSAGGKFTVSADITRVST